MQLQALCIISWPLVYSKLSYSPEMPNLGQIRRLLEPCDLDLWPLTFTFCMDVTFVIGNNSWQFHDDTIMGT